VLEAKNATARQATNNKQHSHTNCHDYSAQRSTLIELEHGSRQRLPSVGRPLSVPPLPRSMQDSVGPAVAQ
jgi:hypothetical protein